VGVRPERGTLNAARAGLAKPLDTRQTACDEVCARRGNAGRAFSRQRRSRAQVVLLKGMTGRTTFGGFRARQQTARRQ
jgi:hypothetical protein